MIQTLETGDVAAVTGLFFDEFNVAANPDTVTLRVVPPSGVVVTVTSGFGHPSTGVYTNQVLLDQEGVWSFRWEAINPTSVSQTQVLTLGLAGATTPVSVVSIQDYRRITKDFDTLDSDVLANLVDAQGLVEEYLRRLLTRAERTERLPIWPDPTTGQTFVYPLSMPVTSVPASASYQIVYEGAALTGVTWDLTEDDWWFWPVWGVDFISLNPQALPISAVVTYTGGFTQATLPVSIKRAIARAALGLATTTPTSVRLGGSTSLKVGDIAITNNNAGYYELDALIPGLTATIGKWRRKSVRY